MIMQDNIELSAIHEPANILSDMEKKAMYTSQRIQDTVKNYISERIGLENLDVETHIFEEGLVNSLFAIELMTFLEKAFAIKVGMNDLDMTYYQSVTAITAFVWRKLEEK